MLFIAGWTGVHPSLIVLVSVVVVGFNPAAFSATPVCVAANPLDRNVSDRNGCAVARSTHCTPRSLRIKNRPRNRYARHRRHTRRFRILVRDGALGRFGSTLAFPRCPKRWNDGAVIPRPTQIPGVRLLLGKTPRRRSSRQSSRRSTRRTGRQSRGRSSRHVLGGSYRHVLKDAIHVMEYDHDGGGTRQSHVQCANTLPTGGCPPRVPSDFRHSDVSVFASDDEPRGAHVRRRSWPAGDYGGQWCQVRSIDWEVVVDTCTMVVVAPMAVDLVVDGEEFRSQW